MPAYFTFQIKITESLVLGKPSIVIHHQVLEVVSLAWSWLTKVQDSLALLSVEVLEMHMTWCLCCWTGMGVAWLCPAKVWPNLVQTVALLQKSCISECQWGQLSASIIIPYKVSIFYLLTAIWKDTLHRDKVRRNITILLLLVIERILVERYVVEVFVVFGWPTMHSTLWTFYYFEILVWIFSNLSNDAYDRIGWVSRQGHCKRTSCARLMMCLECPY